MIVAVLQARTSSSRLFRKVMLPVAGAPMLARQIERLQRACSLDRLIVATSDLAEDDCVAELAASAGIDSFRGSLNDVLDRYYRAAEPFEPRHVVRVTGDCPLADWDVIDRTVEFALSGGYDYTSNTINPTWPDGLDVEVVTFEALRTAWSEATSAIDREHVLPFIHRQPDRFSLGSFEGDMDLSGLRWTVDEPADYDFVSRVYDILYPANPAFTTNDILKLLATQPELMSLNAGIERNEGLRKAEQALLKDRNI